MGLIFGLAILVLFLSVLALVGHGLYVLVRVVLGWVGQLSTGAVEQPVLVPTCPRCGSSLVLLAATSQCEPCGWSTHERSRTDRSRPSMALFQLRRSVDRYVRMGLISEVVRDQIFQAISPAGIITPPAKPIAAPTADRLPPLPVLEPIRPLVADQERSSQSPKSAALGSRVKAFREFTEDKPAPAAAAATLEPPAPRQHLFELLSAFLEEKSIRWGELVGGLLIVGCSLALVISFWSSIAERPLLKYVLLNGVTATLFGLGLHAERRWKLPTTALGLLIIATLLTPLNFLAVASLVQGEAARPIWALGGELAAVAIFALLVLRAGKFLVAAAPWALALGVVAPSSSMLLMSRSIAPGQVLSSALVLGAIPWLVAAGAIGGWSVRTRRQAEVGEASAVELLRLLGLVAFASSVALGLVLVHAGPFAGLAGSITPLAPLIGGTILVPGLILWRRVNAPDLVGYRTAGTTIAAAGTLILLAGVVLAWPTPARVVPVAVLDCVVFALIALVFRVPAAHALAGACLALVYQLGWFLVTGKLGWQEGSSDHLTAVLLSGASGTALVPITLIGGVVAALLARANRRLDAQAYALVAALAGLLSLGLVTWDGFGQVGDPSGATWIYLAYAVAATVGAVWFGRDPLIDAKSGETEALALGWLGSGLLLASLVQGLMFGGLPVHPGLPLVVALLAHGTLTTLGSVLLLRRPGEGLTEVEAAGDEFAPPRRSKFPDNGLVAEIMDRSTQATTLVAAIVLVMAGPFAASLPSLAANGLWLAVLWVGLAWRFRSPKLFAAGQAGSVWAVACFVAAILNGQSWWSSSALPWLDPRTVQAEGIALGLLALGWIVARLGVRRWSKTLPTFSQLLDPPWPAFDRYLRAAVVVAFLGLAMYAVVPGVAQELTPRDVAARLAGTEPGGRIVPPLEVFEIRGIPHAPALGAASWALLGLTITLLLAGQWERFRRSDLLVAMVVGTMAAPLLAGYWELSVATATVLRWASAVALLATSALIWDRERLARWAWQVGWRPDQTQSGLSDLSMGIAFSLAVLPLLAMGLYVASAAVVGRPLAAGLGEIWVAVGLLFVMLGGVSLAIRGGRVWVRPLLGVLATLPVMAVTIFVVTTALAGNPMVGPEPGSFFRRIGPPGSFVPPIVLMAATLVGFAIRERSSRFAFAAGLAWNVAATVGYLTLAARLGSRFDTYLVVRLAQLNALVSALTALAWIGSLAWARRRAKREGPAPVDELLMASVTLGVTLNLLVLAGATLALGVNPIPSPVHEIVAGLLGAMVLVVVAGAVIARARLVGQPLGQDWYGVGVVAVVDLFALGLAHRDHGNWLAYHGVLGGMALTGCALPALAWWAAGQRLAAVTAEVRGAVVRWSSLALGVAVLFAIRAYWSDPLSPWPTVGALVAMAGLAASLALWSSRLGFLKLGSGLVNLAATCWWCSTLAWSTGRGGWPNLIDLINLNIIALAVPCVLWGWVERRLPPSKWFGAIPWHRVVAWGGLAALSLVVVVTLAQGALGEFGEPLDGLGWLAFAAVALALGTGLLDATARMPVAGLYLLGLVAAGWTLAEFHLPPRWLGWTGTMVLAAYSVATSYLWSRRTALRSLADRLRIPRPDADDPVANLGWLVPSNLVLAVGVLILAFGTILTDPSVALRSASSQAAMAEVLAIGLLARGARRTMLQRITLGVGTLGMVAWGWALIEPGAANSLADRGAVVLVATAGAAALYGLGLAKLRRIDNDWTEAARQVVPWLLGLAGFSLLLLLGGEVATRAQGDLVAISPPAIAAVALTLAGAVVAALIAAVVPGRDPLGLAERERTAYVYGAEILLVLLGAHIKLTIPWMFSGLFVQYWPLVLMGVAFVGVGLSEVFRRQGRPVLAEPLERTGAFLPALPLLASFWIAPRPGEEVVYFVLVACLYATLASIRSSLIFSSLAALAGNVAFWSWLSYQDRLGFLAHPQVWVIPPALCVLIGAHLNRDRLTQVQTAGIRYAALLAIYLASTADLVLTGVARAPWLPAILAGLSVAGILVGIMLRVRGFLFLGLGFLSLALFSIIWYAAVDLHQTWLWAASGVVAGILILTMFALFEKKRQEVLQVVGQLKEWNP